MKYPRIYLIVPQAQKISSYLSTTFFIGNMLTEKNLRNFFLNFKTFFIKIFFQVTIFIVKYVYIRLQLIKIFISISISMDVQHVQCKYIYMYMCKNANIFFAVNYLVITQLFPHRNVRYE